MADGDPVENLIQRGLIRVGDQAAAEVLLQRLMGTCGSLAQDTVSVFGNVFDLHTRHGAIMALVAPYCERFRSDLLVLITIAASARVVALLLSDN